MIVGLCGKKRVGKDTLADLIERHYGNQKIAFADALRATLYATNPLLDADGTRVQDAVDLYGYEGIKSTKYSGEYRSLMQRLGTDGVRDNIGDSTWVDIVKRNISAGGDWTVIDARFPNEIQAVRDSGGIILWVHRPGVESDDSHASENSVTQDDCDFIIYNHGTPADMLSQFKRYMDA